MRKSSVMLRPRKKLKELRIFRVYEWEERREDLKRILERGRMGSLDSMHWFHGRGRNVSGERTVIGGATGASDGVVCKFTKLENVRWDIPWNIVHEIKKIGYNILHCLAT
jgi:hypothetical protein